MSLKDRITSLDVARHAGVSQSAVSRVFTPGASASAKTAEKVRKAAQELGYRPNSLARAMVSGKSGIIGVVVAYLHNQFYPTALEKLSAQLQSRGYHVMIFMASQTSGNIDDIVEEIIDYQVDGIIAASVSLSSELTARCQQVGVPLVLFNRSQDDPDIPAVTSNNYSGGFRVAEFLTAGQHQRIGYIAGWEGASTQRDRERGFLAGLQKAALNLFARGVGDFQSETAHNATLDMFTSNSIPDAVFVANDHMAFAVMDTLRYELGLRIPEDVSVIGYDDVPAASWKSYSLTTVKQPADDMVEQAVTMLLAKIEGQILKTQKKEIEGSLIIRGSAKIPEGWKDEGV